MESCLVVVTGASGSVYGLRLTEQLLRSGIATTFMATRVGIDVMAYETPFTLPSSNAAESLLRFLELPDDTPLRVADTEDLFDTAASGSSAPEAMVVCPASMGFVAAVAAGMASDLPERAADVMLKQRLPLVLVPRETPLSLIHLRNMTALTEAGAVILPAMPAFYQKPSTVDDMVDFVVGKVLDVLHVEHELYPRWGE